LEILRKTTINLKRAGVPTAAITCSVPQHCLTLFCDEPVGAAVESLAF
jgi:hypothetical protein